MAAQGTMTLMDERERVTQVEAMKDDPDAWGEPEPKRTRKSERRQRGAVVSVRFTPEELEQVQARASERGMSMSAYLRSMALQASARHVAVTRWYNTIAANSSLADVHTLVREGEAAATVS